MFWNKNKHGAKGRLFGSEEYKKLYLFSFDIKLPQLEN